MGGNKQVVIVTYFIQMTSSTPSFFFSALLCVAVALFLGGCGGGSGQMTSRALHSLMVQGKSPVIVDVRSAGEYDRGHISGAIHIPFTSVARRHQEISADKQRPVVVYCAHGPRAWWAAFVLRRHGFSKVTTLEGHFETWQEGGFAADPQ